jgi:hypothetical protein
VCAAQLCGVPIVVESWLISTLRNGKPAPFDDHRAVSAGRWFGGGGVTRRPLDFIGAVLNIAASIIVDLWHVAMALAVVCSYRVGFLAYGLWTNERSNWRVVIVDQFIPLMFDIVFGGLLSALLYYVVVWPICSQFEQFPETFVALVRRSSLSESLSLVNVKCPLSMTVVSILIAVRLALAIGLVGSALSSHATTPLYRRPLTVELLFAVGITALSLISTCIALPCATLLWLIGNDKVRIRNSLLSN